MKGFKVMVKFSPVFIVCYLAMRKICFLRPGLIKVPPVSTIPDLSIRTHPFSGHNQVV